MVVLVENINGGENIYTRVGSLSRSGVDNSAWLWDSQQPLFQCQQNVGLYFLVVPGSIKYNWLDWIGEFAQIPTVAFGQNWRIPTVAFGQNLMDSYSSFWSEFDGFLQ